VISPDGERVAYRTGNAARGRATVRLYTLATTEDRELFSGEGPITNCVWASRPPVLYCGQLLQAEGKTAILSIDVATRRAESLASFPGIRMMERLSPDERILQMVNLSGPTPWPRWEIGADQEVPGLPLAPYSSFDGRWAVRIGSDSSKRQEFQIRPGSAGDEAWKRLVYIRKQAPDERNEIAFKFTPDGNWLVYHDLDSDGQDALLRVSTSGGEPQRLGDYPTSFPNSYLNISPDGRHFLVAAVRPTPSTSATQVQQTDYWLLQNFLPGTAPKP
jgi:Tol biopolymer transport system component